LKTKIKIKLSTIKNPKITFIIITILIITITIIVITIITLIITIITLIITHSQNFKIKSHNQLLTI